jgi:hypothetical protein
VVYFGGEVAFGWAKWVVRRKAYVEEEDASSIWTIISTHDEGLPVELIVILWTYLTIYWGILLDIDEFLL